MKESIHIKNLGPIVDIQIDELKLFTVLIGESGSGKSTLMKAISLFRWIYKMQNIKSYLKHSSIGKSPFRFRMDSYFKNCGFDQFIRPDTLICYTAHCSQERSYQIRYENNKLIGTSDRDLINPDDISLTKISFISETRNIIPLWADKGASFTGGYLGFYFHEVYRDFDLASDALKKIDLDYLDLKFEVKKKGFGKKFTIKSVTDAYELDYKNSSSGTQTTVPIALLSQYYSKHFSFEDAFKRSVLSYLMDIDNLTEFNPIMNLSDIQKNIYIHIEEPELSLYPDAQCKLMNQLVNQCFISNRQPIELFISTHSPYIINHLNLLIKAHDRHTDIEGASIQFEQLAVYRIEDGRIENLMVQNDRLVNTNVLSDPINSIYDQYNAL